jgi:uncharacterized membrane protein YidH (DUF202 family)
MTAAAGSILPLILVAIGFGCVILSFLVPDRKKSLISLTLAGIIILVGIINLASGSIAQYRWNQRMRSMQRERQADLDALREKMKDSLPKPTAPATNK